MIKNRIFGKGLLRKWLFWFLLVAAAIVLYKSFDRLSDVFGAIGSVLGLATPILIAFGIAYFLNLPMCFLERQLGKIKKPRFISKHTRGFAVLIVYIVFIALVVLLGYALVPLLIEGINTVFADPADMISKVSGWFNDLAKEYPFLERVDFGDTVINMLEKLVGSLDISTITGTLSRIGNVGSTMANIAVSLFVSIYMLLDKESILAAFSRFFGLFIREKRRDALGRYISRVNAVVYRYFATQLADCVLVSFMATIALIIMRTPSPVLLGFVFGMFNIIPYFGPIIGGVSVVLIILLTRGFGTALTATIVLLVLQQVDANIINPKILGASLDLGPFWVILAITVGGGLFGFAGMLLGVPALVVVRMLYRDVLRYYTNKRERELAAEEERKAAQRAAPDGGGREQTEPQPEAQGESTPTVEITDTQAASTPIVQLSGRRRSRRRR